MQLLNSVSECIEYAKTGVADYANIVKMITPTDYKDWTVKLQSQTDYEAYLFDVSKLNLLNVAILNGYRLKSGLSDNTFDHYERLLRKLNNYLLEFSGLIANKSFKGKICNLEGVNFLATLSELSLASYFSKMQLSVVFESPFKLTGSNKKRDVDLSVIDAAGKLFHMDVYMPNEQVEIEGFFDINEGDYHFEYKIGRKLIDKFGTTGISGLNGTVLLAVNIAFFDWLRVKRTVEPYDYGSLVKFLPEGVDGFLFYEDGFDSELSLHVYQIVFSPSKLPEEDI